MAINKPKFRVVVAGSRGFDDLALLAKRMDKILGNISESRDIVIVSGGARGADETGEFYALSKGYDVERYPADWEKYGKGAGPIRNKEMLEIADAVVVFWDGKSRGTMNMKNITEDSGKPLRVIRI